MRTSDFQYRILSLCILVVITLGLAGCGAKLVHHAKVEYSEDAANVYVSAYPVIPWSDISAKLEPKNNLSITEARTLAAQTTQSQISQFLSTFAAGLGLGLPTRTQSITAQLAADGTESTTGTKTSSYGNVPSSSGIPSNAAIVPSLSPAVTPVSIDGNTYLTAGTALYQQAQIMDNQISKGILPGGYQANLVTLQVNLQPKQRDVSYDAYTDVSLLPSNWEEALAASDAVNREVGGLQPVIIYPLVIMDAMETASVGRTIEVIRQAALTLSGVLGNIGVNAGTSGGTAKADSIVGLDKNSLITVGRVSDHTVRIRLGAVNSGSAGLALLPRIYNVSLVVLTRWDAKTDGMANPIRVHSLEAITHTEFVSTDDGSVLKSGPTRDRPELAKKVHEAVCDFSHQPVVNECAAYVKHGSPGPTPCVDASSNFNLPTLTPLDIEANLELLRAVDRADYSHVDKCLALRSAEFSVKDFKTGKDIEHLCKAIKSDNYTFNVIKAPENSVDWLNAVLRQPDFYDQVNASSKNIDVTSAIKQLAERTVDTRKQPFQPFSKLRYYEQKEMKALNRLMLEAAYPDLIPPNMTFSSNLNVQHDIKLQRLLGKLIEIQIDSRYSTFRIGLQNQPDPELPVDTQLALYADDGKNVTSFVLRGGKGLDPKSLQASLTMKEKRNGRNENLKLLPSTLSLSGDGAEIILSFPSLTKLGYKPADLEEFPLFLSLSSNPTKSASYKIRETGVVEVPAVKNPVRATSAVLIADQNNVARTTLQVETYDTKILTKVLLKIDGADVRLNSAIGSAAITSDGVSVTSGKPLTLELGNLSPARLVTLTTIDYGVTPPKTLGEPITFTVDLAARTAK